MKRLNEKVVMKMVRIGLESKREWDRPARARSLWGWIGWALLGALLARPAWASFEDLGTGARATGLGGAFTALSDDVHALYYNPAGLVYLKRKEFSATYGLLHTGLGDQSKISNSYVGYGQPVRDRIGTFGLSWSQLSVSELYSERAITLGYGRRMSQKWAMGMNLKHLTRQFSAPNGQTDSFAVTDPSKSDPVFASGDARSNIGLDLGFLFRPYRNYAWGLMFQNLNEPDLAISEANHDPLPMTARLGLAYNERTLTLIGELDTKRFANSRDFLFTTGAEKWWLGSGFARGDLALRGSLGFGSRSFSQLTMGLSYRLEAVQLDYGFLMNLGGISFGNSQGNHRITLTLRFGKTLAEPDYELRMRAAELAARQAEKELEGIKLESERLAAELELLKRDAEKRKAAIEQARVRSGSDAAVKETAARFAESMDHYWRKKSAGAGLAERLAVLAQILREYSGTGIDVSVAEKEMDVVKSDRAKAEVDLSISWNYYQKIVARGVSAPERIQLLSQMIERFARTGVNLTPLQEELKTLKRK